MKRRDFVILFGAMVGVWACADAFAAKTSRTARIGILWQLPPPSSEYEDVLRAGLAALGWREGENLQIEQRVAGNLANLPRFATELVSLRPDVLICPGSTETKALQAATRDIPIVFANSSDRWLWSRGQHCPPRQKHHRNSVGSATAVEQTARAGRGAAWASTRESRLADES